MKASLSIFVLLLLLMVSIASAVLQNILDDDYNSMLGMGPDHPADSCREIYTKNLASYNQSGYYWIKSCNGVIQVYCDMYLTCGDMQGGWRKIADIQNGENCPDTWQQITMPGTSKKVCRSKSDAAGMYSAFFPTSNKSCMLGFQHFCGKAIGYQKGSDDGFERGGQIDWVYLDGVSITYGKPRKHLWSLAIGASSEKNYPNSICPCAMYPGVGPPSFVRDHYYCDSGNRGLMSVGTYYTDNPVWDGEGCTSDYSCCAQAGMPYFYRQFPVIVYGDVEVRLSATETFSNEGTLIDTLELYVL